MIINIFSPFLVSLFGFYTMNINSTDAHIACKVTIRKENIRCLLIDHDGKNQHLHGINHNKCIDRIQFEDLLLHFFDFINIGMHKETIIILGSLTGLGKWIIDY